MSGRPQSSKADTSELRKAILRVLRNHHMYAIDWDDATDELETLITAQKQRWQIEARKDENNYWIQESTRRQLSMSTEDFDTRIAALDAATGGQDKEGTIHATFYKDEIDVGNLEES